MDQRLLTIEDDGTVAGLGKTLKKLLIVDDDETFTLSMASLLKGCEEFFVINSQPIKSKEQACFLIKFHSPNIIILDHNLNDCVGLDVIESMLRKMAEEKVLILSTGIEVVTSKELTDAYRKAGAHHFPGKTFPEIIKCIEGNCGCYSPLISFLP